MVFGLGCGIVRVFEDLGDGWEVVKVGDLFEIVLFDVFIVELCFDVVLLVFFCYVYLF